MARFSNIVKEAQSGPIEQKVGESISSYSIDTSPWGGSPTSITSVTAYDVTGTKTAATGVVTGSGSYSGDDIAVPTITLPTVDHVYNIEVKFVNASGTQIAVLPLRAVQ